MTAPCSSVCSPYATTADMEALGCEVTALSERMLGVASDVLFNLSGLQFPGSCLDTIRPCRNAISCGCNPSSCGCGHVSYVTLPNGPITGITEVHHDGNLLDASGYRIDDWERLVWLGTEGEGWMCCPNILLGTDQPGTFSITYTYGQMPPDAGVLAAAELACELGKLATDEECAFPRGVSSVTREGITINVASVVEIMKNGSVGLPFSDLFLATFNPDGRRRRSIVFNPDTVPVATRTDT